MLYFSEFFSGLSPNPRNSTKNTRQIKHPASQRAAVRTHVAVRQLRPQLYQRSVYRMLKIYNTLAREKQEFVPIDARQGAHVRLRHDGIRLLPSRARARDGRVRRRAALAARDRAIEVTYVRNITDIDDKIIKRAQENGEPIEALTARFIQAMDEDAAALGIEKPDFEPRATEYVPGMLEMIRVLEARGLAYRADDGDVNYAVRKFPGLRQALRQVARRSARGRARRGRRGQARPARFRAVEAREGRRAVLGIAVGQGRPGWHIECSAMSSALLGHAFRHPRRRPGPAVPAPRERDRAVRRRAPVASSSTTGCTTASCASTTRRCRSRSATSSPCAKCSRRYDAEVVRFFIVRAHYRSPLNYSDQHLDDARHALDAALHRAQGLRRRRRRRSTGTSRTRRASARR